MKTYIRDIPGFTDMFGQPDDYSFIRLGDKVVIQWMANMGDAQDSGFFAKIDPHPFVVSDWMKRERGNNLYVYTLATWDQDDAVVIGYADNTLIDFGSLCEFIKCAEE